MLARQTRKFAMLGKLRTFRDVHAVDIKTGSLAKKEFDNVDSVVTKIIAARAGQHPAKDREKATLIAALYHVVHKVLHTADAIDIDEPGFARQFHSSIDPSDKPLLAAEKILEVLSLKDTDDDAVKAAKAAKAAKFVANEMPEDFVTSLEQQVSVLNKQEEGDEIVRTLSIGDTKELEVLLESGMDSARKLDAMMRNKYDGNAEVLAEWHAARHIEADPKKHEDEPPTPPTPPPA